MYYSVEVFDKKQRSYAGVNLASIQTAFGICDTIRLFNCPFTLKAIPGKSEHVVKVDSMEKLLSIAGKLLDSTSASTKDLGTYANGHKTRNFYEPFAFMEQGIVSLIELK